MNTQQTQKVRLKSGITSLVLHKLMLSRSVLDLQLAMQQIRAVLGEVPIVPAEQVRVVPFLSDRTSLNYCSHQRLLEASEAEARDAEELSGGAAPQTKTKVLADGTYATETVFSTPARLDTGRSSKPPLRCELCSSPCLHRWPLDRSMLIQFHNNSSHPRRRLLHSHCACFHTGQDCSTLLRAFHRPTSSQRSEGRGYAHHDVSHPCRPI